MDNTIEFEFEDPAREKKHPPSPPPSPPLPPPPPVPLPPPLPYPPMTVPDGLCHAGCPQTPDACTALDEPWRSVGNAVDDFDFKCDDDETFAPTLQEAGWYCFW